MVFTPHSSPAFRDLDLIRIDLRKCHDLTKSYRKAGELYGLSGAMARLLIMGYDPGPKVRKQLHIAPSASVIVVAGEVPPGAQVIGATQCACGQWFVSNHPCRTRCFMCSPYRGKKRRLH